jgi:histidine ammonia-lyase
LNINQTVMSAIHFIDTNPLDLTTIQAIIFEGKKLALSTSTQDKINACRLFLDEKTKSISKLLYVINTGFGALYNVKISDNNLQKLQENLV